MAMDNPVKSYPFVRGDLLSLTGTLPAKMATADVTSASGSIRHPKHPGVVSELVVTLAPYVDANTDRGILIECAPEVTAGWPDGQMIARVRFLPMGISTGPIFIDVGG